MGERNVEYYEGAALDDLVNTINWKDLFPVLYATTRGMIFKRYLSDPDRGIRGMTFKDFVHEAVRGFLEGKRRCPKHIKIEQFFVETIRSIITKHLAKHYSTVSVDSTDEEILKAHYMSINMTYDHSKVQSYVFKTLDGDDISKNIFECWAEGIDKPADIRELHGYSEAIYNNGKKRLLRVLKDIRTHLKNER